MDRPPEGTVGETSDRRGRGTSGSRAPAGREVSAGRSRVGTDSTWRTRGPEVPGRPKSCSSNDRDVRGGLAREAYARDAGTRGRAQPGRGRRVGVRSRQDVDGGGERGAGMETEHDLLTGPSLRELDGDWAARVAGAARETRDEWLAAADRMRSRDVDGHQRAQSCYLALRADLDPARARDADRLAWLLVSGAPRD